MSRRGANGTAYELTGPADAPAIALIHGLGLNRHVWRRHEPAFAARYRVVNYDLYGHGDSALPHETPSLTLFARQLRELLDELGIESCTLVGFSLGGMINRRFAIDYPDRVSALAILNSPHERDPEAQRLVEARAEQSTEGPGATLEDALARWFTTEYREANLDVIEEVRRWVLANETEPYAQSRRVLAAGVVELIRPDPPIAAPTLVMTCEDDVGSTPEMTRAIASEIPGSKSIVLQGLKHMGLVEQPDAFTAPVLAFLDALR